MGLGRLGWLRERPFVGLIISVALHLTLVAVLVLLGGPFAKIQVKRGEPLFVELPDIPEPAPAGNPAAKSLGPVADQPAPPAVKPAPPAAKPAPARPAPAVVASVQPRPAPPRSQP